VALPVGRLSEEAASFLIKRNLLTDGVVDFNDRRLLFEDSDKKLRIILVRNMDVPVYVEYGATDIGIVGKDVILEMKSDVYEVLDLKFGKCKLCVAGPLSFGNKYKHDMKIATKYPNITKDFFINKGYFVDTIKLYGSVEIAPLFNLAHLIVDLVSTGETLKKNGLSIIDVVLESSARLVANKNLMRIKHDRIKSIMDILC
jgi:ATP phosphoribosyltransferase